jgi:hypothetical protein
LSLKFAKDNLSWITCIISLHNQVTKCILIGWLLAGWQLLKVGVFQNIGDDGRRLAWIQTFVLLALKFAGGRRKTKVWWKSTGGPTMSYDWNNIVFIFKNLLESLDNRLFLLSKFCKHFKLLESLYYHSTWSIDDRLQVRTAGAKRWRRRKKGELN